MLRLSSDRQAPSPPSLMAFHSNSEVKCQFAGDLTTEATRLSPSQVKCITPVGNATSESCAGEAVELMLGPGLLTDNRVPLRRIATPSILNIAPGRGYFSQTQWVRVEGYGFLNSAQISCRFFAGDQVRRGCDAGPFCDAFSEPRSQEKVTAPQ